MPASASQPKCQAVEGRLERRVRQRSLRYSLADAMRSSSTLAFLGNW